EVPVHAARRNSASPALHHAIEGIAGVGHDRAGLRGQRPIEIVHLRGLGGTPLGRVKVVSVMISLVVSAEEADSQTQVHRQILGGVEVILEIRFEYFVPVVILGLRAGLSEVGDLAHQKISEGISGGDGGGVVKIEKAVHGRFGRAELILLRRDKIASELKVMPANDLGY